MNYYIGMDIGGTHSRLKIEDESGNMVGEYLGTGCTINTNGPEKCRELYREAVLSALSHFKLLPEHCTGICVAASGIDNEELEQICRAIFIEMGFKPEAVMIYNDCEVFLHTSPELSMVLVAGTGSIAFGRTEQNKIVRCGGWGHLLSDEGSALDIAKRIIQAVGNHMDERVFCPILSELFIKETGITDMISLNHYLNENIMDEKSKIASFAQMAERATEKGDSTARQILLDCADALFCIVSDLYKKMHVIPPTAVTLWLWGSVLEKNEIILQRIKERVEKELPGVLAKVPLWSAVDTALMVAKRNRA